jgi:hypothetical protein
MQDKNRKIENFFSNQLNELKAHYENKRGGRVYTEPTKEKALNRCLELADFAVCLEDIHWERLICNCDFVIDTPKRFSRHILSLLRVLVHLLLQLPQLIYFEESLMIHI